MDSLLELNKRQGEELAEKRKMVEQLNNLLEMKRLEIEQKNQPI